MGRLAVVEVKLLYLFSHVQLSLIILCKTVKILCDPFYDVSLPHNPPCNLFCDFD